MERSGLRIKKILLKGLKSSREKKFYFRANLGLINHYSLSQSSQDFYGIGATIHIGQEMLCLPYAGFVIKKSRKNLQGVLFCRCRSKKLFLAKINSF